MTVGELVEELKRFDPSLPVGDEQVSRLRQAQKDNSQVTDAWTVASALKTLEARLGSSKPAAPSSGPTQYDYGEPPF